MMTFVDRNNRPDSRRRSTRGRRVRSSTNVKATSNAVPTTHDTTTVVDDHDWSGPSDTPYMRRPRPAPPRTKPGTSKPTSVGGAQALEEERPERHRQDPDRQVDEEDPPPAEVGDQEPAEHRSDRRRQGGRHREDAGGADALGRWEDPVEHRHADRRHHPATGALDDPEHDELGDVLRQPTEHRSEGEDDDGDEQHPFAAEAVAQPPRGGDEDGQAHQVGDDDAVDGRRRNVEVTPDRGQSHVHDGDVHDVHEHRRHEDDTDHDLLIESWYSHRPALLSVRVGRSGDGVANGRHHCSAPTPTLGAGGETPVHAGRRRPTCRPPVPDFQQDQLLT